MVIDEHDEMMSEEECESQAVRHVGKVVSARKEVQDWCFLDSGPPPKPLV